MYGSNAAQEKRLQAVLLFQSEIFLGNNAADMCSHIFSLRPVQFTDHNRPAKINDNSGSFYFGKMIFEYTGGVYNRHRDYG